MKQNEGQNLHVRSSMFDLFATKSILSAFNEWESFRLSGVFADVFAQQEHVRVMECCEEFKQPPVSRAPVIKSSSNVRAHSGVVGGDGARSYGREIILPPGIFALLVPIRLLPPMLTTVAHLDLFDA